MFDSREELIHTAVYMIDKRNRSELYHHGILGMKWGVRRYQNEDGSLTPAGEKRYYVNGKDDREGYTKAGQKYKDKMDKKNAEPSESNEEAYNKRNKKLLIGIGIAAGLTIAAGVAIYKTPEIKEFINTQLDENIRVGDVMQNISVRDTGSQNRDFAYVVNANSEDANKYKGFYTAEQLIPRILNRSRGNVSTREVSEHTVINDITARQNGKIAGGINATKSMNKILKGMTDTEKSNLLYSLTNFGVELTPKLTEDIRSGNISKDTYSKLNFAIMDDRGKGMKNFRDKVFQDLKDRGYSGIKDNNDRMSVLKGGSGYHAKANILFKDDSKFDYSKLRKMSYEEASEAIDKGRDLIMGKHGDPITSRAYSDAKYIVAGRELIKNGGIMGAAVGISAASIAANNRQRKTSSSGLSKSDISSINSLKNRGMTNSEIAKRLGVSESTVSNYLK